MIDPQQVVERALAARTVDESLVIVTDASEASLRWANNSIDHQRSFAVPDVDGDLDRARG